MRKWIDRRKDNGSPGLERRFGSIIEMYKSGPIKSIRELIHNYNKHSKLFDFFHHLKLEADSNNKAIDFELAYKIAIDYINDGDDSMNEEVSGLKEMVRQRNIRIEELENINEGGE